MYIDPNNIVRLLRGVGDVIDLDTGVDDAMSQLIKRLCDIIDEYQIDLDTIPQALRYQQQPPCVHQTLAAFASGGNSSLKITERNTRFIRLISGGQYPVYAGSSCGFGKSFIPERAVDHGSSGLGNTLTNEKIDDLLKKQGDVKKLIEMIPAHIVLANMIKGTTPFTYSVTGPSSTFLLAVLEIQNVLEKESKKAPTKEQQCLIELQKFQSALIQLQTNQEDNQDDVEALKKQLSQESRNVLMGVTPIVNLISAETLAVIQKSINEGILRSISVMGGVLPETELSIRSANMGYEPKYLQKATKQDPARNYFGNSYDSPLVEFNVEMDPIAARFMYDLATVLASRQQKINDSHYQPLVIVGVELGTTNRVIISQDHLADLLEDDKAFKEEHNIVDNDDSIAQILCHLFDCGAYDHRIEPKVDANGNQIHYQLVHDVFVSLYKLYPSLFRFNQVNVVFDDAQDPQYTEGTQGMMGIKQETDPNIHHYMLELPEENRLEFIRLFKENIKQVSRLQLMIKHDLSPAFSKDPEDAGIAISMKS